MLTGLRKGAKTAISLVVPPSLLKQESAMQRFAMFFVFFVFFLPNLQEWKAIIKPLLSPCLVYRPWHPMSRGRTKVTLTKVSSQHWGQALHFVSFNLQNDVDLVEEAQEEDHCSKGSD